eukprot:TRINITY_DN12364_c0_g1_i3.p1 TRINITY_DN12364_c0_g1~~TRINITY_DN12364_c0_g1_i3.p1  ORF type:complete len:367 (-),score=74.04 TRINITY_DN12364_c0_g1_i3:151-1251(-)
MEECSEQNCIVCYDTIYREETRRYGIRCVGPEKHFVCTMNGCFVELLQLFMTGEELVCSVCTHPYKEEDLIEELDEKQRQIVEYIRWKQLEKGDIRSCAFCSYFEYIGEGVKDLPHDFHCKSPGCLKITCQVCNMEMLKTKAEGKDEHNWEEHLECLELSEIKKNLEDIIANSNTMKCPNCNVVGRKDENCMHIYCYKCLKSFCYFCGLHFDDFCSHNQNWKQDPTNCPQYLKAINEIDPRWPKDDNEALDLFHSMKIEMNLQKEIKKLVEVRKMEALRRAEERFGIFKQLGLTIDEVYTKEYELIKRQAPPPPPPPAPVPPPAPQDIIPPLEVVPSPQEPVPQLQALHDPEESILSPLFQDVFNE